jgi:hypothetical protein
MQEMFNVYRPPHVLSKNKDLFRNLPITISHPPEAVTRYNAQKYMHGLTGDTVEAEFGEDGELYLYSTGVITTDAGIEFYEKYKEMSMGYFPVMDWSSGVHNGQEYQIVMKDMRDANHAAICKQARGGHQIRALDSTDIPKKERYMGDVLYKAMCLAAGAKDDSTKYKLVVDSIDKPEKIKGAMEFASKLLAKVPASDSKTELEGNIKEFMALDSIEDSDLVQIRDYVRDAGCALLVSEKKEEPAKDEKKDPEEKKEEKKEEAAKDEKAEFAKLIGDSVSAAVMSAFTAVGLVPTKDEKKEEKKEEPKKPVGDASMKIEQPKAGSGLTSDSIMDELFGRVKKEDK